MQPLRALGPWHGRTTRPSSHVRSSKSRAQLRGLALICGTYLPVFCIRIVVVPADCPRMYDRCQRRATTKHKTTDLQPLRKLAIRYVPLCVQAVMALTPSVWPRGMSAHAWAERVLRAGTFRAPLGKTRGRGRGATRAGSDTGPGHLCVSFRRRKRAYSCT